MYIYIIIFYNYSILEFADGNLTYILLLYLEHHVQKIGPVLHTFQKIDSIETFSID